MPPNRLLARRPPALIGLAAVLALALAVPPAAGQRAPAGHRTAAARTQLTDSAAALHLLQRATFGPRPADLAAVLRQGRAAWLDAQLHPERIDDSALETRLAAYPAALMSVAELYRAYPPPAAVRRAQQQAAGAAAGADSMRGLGAGGRRDADMMAGDSARPRPPRPLAGANSAARLVGEVAGARLARDVYSERQLQEVMTDFWFNHFNVFVGKGPDRWLVSRYEQDAIRPYVFGRFEDMLKATASHPAMLVYLDNWTSASPDTTDPRYLRRQEQLRTFAALAPAQQQALVDAGRLAPEQLQRLRQAVQQLGRRKPGINENYARELMELHTLGVDGGYTQADVVAVARAFTGWTITRPRITPDAPPDADVAFVFRPELHDRAEKVVLGTPLRPGRGMEDGLEVLHMLATSPATAHHLARELVEHFVSDRPDSAMVERLARVFLDTDGDLRAVTRALFTDPGFDDPRNVASKVKTPVELLASALRASDADVGPGPSRALLQTLRTLGELPYAASFPTGYPAAADEWVNSGAMLARMNFALALAAGRLDRVRVQPAALAGAPADTVAALAAAFLPATDTRRLQLVVRSELAQQPTAAPGERFARAAGLILGSPEFQRR
jgi:uncharacterized protein (DUF1800 family)